MPGDVRTRPRSTHEPHEARFVRAHMVGGGGLKHCSVSHLGGPFAVGPCGSKARAYGQRPSALATCPMLPVLWGNCPRQYCWGLRRGQEV